MGSLCAEYIFLSNIQNSRYISTPQAHPSFCVPGLDFPSFPMMPRSAPWNHYLPPLIPTPLSAPVSAHPSPRPRPTHALLPSQPCKHTSSLFRAIHFPQTTPTPTPNPTTIPSPSKILHALMYNLASAHTTSPFEFFQATTKEA